MTDINGSKTPAEIRDLWQTPPQVYKNLNDEFDFVADVAASDLNHLHETYLTFDDDALQQNWKKLFGGGYVYCNPPYSHITPWVEKATEEAMRGVGTVMLVPCDCSVGWFGLALKNADEVRFVINGRLSFIRADTRMVVNGNNKGSVIFIFSPRYTARAKTTYVDRFDLMENKEK